MSKTREEVERLKKSWCCDPCWDLEDTEGFEQYRDELRKFIKAKNEEWEAKAKERIVRDAEKMGIPDNLNLANYIRGLQHSVERLSEEVERLRNH